MRTCVGCRGSTVEGDGAEEPSSALPYVASLSRLLATAAYGTVAAGAIKTG